MYQGREAGTNMDSSDHAPDFTTLLQCVALNSFRGCVVSMYLLYF